MSYKQTLIEQPDRDKTCLFCGGRPRKIYECTPIVKDRSKVLFVCGDDLDCLNAIQPLQLMEVFGESCDFCGCGEQWFRIYDPALKSTSPPFCTDCAEYYRKQLEY